MTLPRYQELRRKASLAMRTGDYEVALGVYHQLENLMPDDPCWLERRAAAYRELGQADEELACLLHALEMQVDSGRVLEAIASCNRILEIEPDHPSTLECLHLLYTEPSMNPGTQVANLTPESEQSEQSAKIGEDVVREPTAPQEPRPLGARPAGDSGRRPPRTAPLIDLELRDVIPGARDGALAGDPEQSVAEIPLEHEVHCEESSPALDLQLDRPAPRRREHSDERSPCERRSAPEVLADTPLFGALPPPVLHDLMTRVRVVRLLAGEMLFREGEPADTLYVVVDGAVVPVAEGPPRKRLAVLERGAFFGEIGLVTDQPRNATIEALVDTRLLAIDRALMWSLVRGHPDMSKILLRFLRERLVAKQLRTNPFFPAFGRAARSAPGLHTSGGRWQRWPASAKARALRTGARAAGSVTCDASATMQTSKVRWAKSAWSAPKLVQPTTWPAARAAPTSATEPAARHASRHAAS